MDAFDNGLLEGYCDGIAGAGMQDRRIDDMSPPATAESNAAWDDLQGYTIGFERGSMDRKDMLA